jgi:predicted TPR repeat methyltransferase
MTATYVRRLFDQQAASFDETLTERLDYRGPEILLEAVRGIAGPRLRVVSMLDLGCGTGLGGAAFRPHVDWLVGVDLSPAMSAKAREKGLYDRLVVDDLWCFLDAEADAHALYHLVLAADVLVYVNDLEPVTASAARVLAPGGFLAFTVETHAGDGVVLQPTLRYAHGQNHVRGAIADAGLELLRLSHASTRTEKGIAVAGLAVVASKPAASAAATAESE